MEVNMIPDTVIRNSPNPYLPITPRLNSNQFIGRESSLLKIKYILEEYRHSSKLKNVVIYGEKSIGKSTLLNRCRQMLEDYNFIVYECELTRDPTVEIYEFEFFKEMLNELFEKYAPPDGAFFDVEQSEIWFSLTSNKYDHDSDYKKRQIGFASQYANYKRGYNETLSYKQMERDFLNIIEQLKQPAMECEGLAILIDEFQEFSRNTRILDILRQLAERLSSIIIICSGLPTFLDNAMFEKFIRGAETINLSSFEKQDIINLILKPLEIYGSYTRFEMIKWFDIKSLMDIIERCGGNPLHLRILCGKMLDYYKENKELKRITLNRSVMEEVMSYYSSISEKSRTIRRSLESCTKDQLALFSMLYNYEGFSFRAAIIAELAFRDITLSSEEETRNCIVNAYKELSDLKLFEIKNKEYTVDDIQLMTPNSLANVEYNFIGDAIDKLYASYFYEELTGNELINYDNKSFEDALAEKLAFEFHKAIMRDNIPTETISKEMSLMIIDNELGTNNQLVPNLISDFNKLKKTTPDDIKSDSKLKTIKEIVGRYNLDYPAYIASLYKFEGYVVMIMDTTIRGKKRFIRDFMPIIKGASSLSFDYKQLTNISIDDSILSKYMININSIHIYLMPLQPLILIRFIDRGDDKRNLVSLVEKRRFAEAIEIAHRISTFDVTMSKDSILYNVESFNDYGFCLINIGKITEAKRVLEKCADKSITSTINLAYIEYCSGRNDNAKLLLNRILRKKIGRDNELRFIHLAIDHPMLLTENKIIENVSYSNIAAWNLALINCQDKKDDSIINAYIKKIDKTTENDRLIDKRVLYWIKYTKGNKQGALEDAKTMFQRIDNIDYIKRAVSDDIKIFSSE